MDVQAAGGRFEEEWTKDEIISVLVRRIQAMHKVRWEGTILPELGSLELCLLRTMVCMAVSSGIPIGDPTHWMTSLGDDFSTLNQPYVMC